MYMYSLLFDQPAWQGSLARAHRYISLQQLLLCVYEVYCAVIDYSFNCITSSVSSLSSHCRRRRGSVTLTRRGIKGSARLVMPVAASSQQLSFNPTSSSTCFLLRTDFRRVLVTGHQRTRNAKPPSAINEWQLKVEYGGQRRHRWRH